MLVTCLTPLEIVLHAYAVPTQPAKKEKANHEVIASNSSHWFVTILLLIMVFYMPIDFPPNQCACGWLP